MTVISNPARKQNDEGGRRGGRTDNRNRGDRTQRDGARQGDRNRQGGRTDRDNRSSDSRQNGGERDNTFRQNREGATGRDNSRRRGGAHRDQAQQALSDIITPDITKNSEKPSKKSNNNNRKDKNRTQGADDFARKRNNARMEANMMDDDALARHRKKPKPKSQQRRNEAEEEQIKVVALPDSMTVMEFAEYLNKPATQIIKALMLKGVMAGLNQQIEFEQAEEIAMDMGILVEHEVEEDIFAA